MSANRGTRGLVIGSSALIALALGCVTSVAHAGCQFGFNPATGKCNDKLPDLLPAPPVLRIIGLPSNATVRLQDPSGSLKDVAALPEGRYRVAPGRRRLAISAPNYFTETVDVLVAPHGETAITVSLRAKPKLSVTTIDHSTAAVVYLDDVKIGTTPLSYVVPSPAGHHVLTLRRPGFIDWTADFELEYVCVASQVTGHACQSDFELEVDQLRNPGQVVLGHAKQPQSDELVDAKVVLTSEHGDQFYGRTGDTIAVPPGTYTVAIGIPGGNWTVPWCEPNEDGSCGANTIAVVSEKKRSFVPRIFFEPKLERAGSSKIAALLNDCDKKGTLLQDCTAQVLKIFKTTSPQDVAFFERVENELDLACANDQPEFVSARSPICTALGYVLAHDPRKKPEQLERAYQLYSRQCDAGPDTEEACLGVAWLLRTEQVGKPAERKKNWQTFAAKACKAADRNWACLYQKTSTAIDPTDYLLEYVPKPSERFNPCLERTGCFLVDIQTAIANETRYPDRRAVYVEPKLVFGGFFKPNFGLVAEIGFRFRTLPQVNLTDPGVGRIYEVALNEHLDLAVQPFRGLGPVLRAGVHGGITFNNGSLFGGFEAAVGYWMMNGLTIEAGALYDDLPTRIVTVHAFGSDHEIRSRDYQLLPFVQLGWRVSP